MTQDYYGTKRVTAWPEANGMTGDDGYCVKYEDGYVSWSPKAVFEKSYQPLTAMSFGHALEVLKTGGRVARAGWNGKEMWLVYVPANEWNLNPGTAHDWGAADSKFPWIGMKTADNKFVPWLASQTDVLANDWTVVL